MCLGSELTLISVTTCLAFAVGAGVLDAVGCVPSRACLHTYRCCVLPFVVAAAAAAVGEGDVVGSTAVLEAGRGDEAPG